jgi:hypothetical protein
MSDDPVVNLLGPMPPRRRLLEAPQGAPRDDSAALAEALGTIVPAEETDDDE